MEDNARARLRLREPGEVVAVVPYLVGHRPDGEIVCLALTGGADGEQVSFLARTGLPAADRGKAAAELAALLASERADAAVVVVYAEAGPELWAALRDELAERRIPLRDGIEVHGGRWRSVLCDNPDCCPPGGRPVIPPWRPGGPARVAAECVGLGLAVSDRPAGR